MERFPEAGVVLHPDDTAAVFEIYIKTTPERLWEAITDPGMRAKYSFGVGTESGWTPGSELQGSGVPGVIDIAEGENVEVDPPRRLVQSMTALWSDEVKGEGDSRVTWEIEPVGDDSCRLTVTHDHLKKGANGELYGGWPMILSGLKTLLETGEDLTTPGSLDTPEPQHERSAPQRRRLHRLPDEGLGGRQEVLRRDARASVRKQWGEMPAGEFETGNVTIAVMQVDAFGIEFSPHRVPLEFHVDDFDAAKAELESRGVEFMGETIDSGICLQALFKDPDGNMLAIHHRYA